MDVTLLRSTSSGAATFPVRLMTLQEFSDRDTSVAGSCQLVLADLGVAEGDLSTIDQAQGMCVRNLNSSLHSIFDHTKISYYDWQLHTISSL